jgi:hypothetical protein
MSARSELLDIQLDTAPAWTRTWGSLSFAERRRERERLAERLTPIMRALAKRRGPEGITASEVIAEAIVAGVLWGEPTFIESYPRVYAWIGPWLAQLARRGSLVPKLVELPGGGQLHVTRIAERGASHRNRNAVYLDPGAAA